MTFKKANEIILWTSFIVLILSYNFWNKLFFLNFYIGNALAIALLTFTLKRQNPNSFICYLLFCGSINNLVDEIFFDNTKIGINEYISLICVPLIWYLQKNEKF